MRRTELIMGMPITVAIPDRERGEGVDGRRAGRTFQTVEQAADAVFDYFRDGG